MTKNDNRPLTAGRKTPESRRGTTDPIDRRGFFRGAAALTVGAFGAPALAQQARSPRDSAAASGGDFGRDGADGSANGSAAADAAERLEAQTRRAQRWGGRDPADWVRPRSGADHNVVIVGGGQSGVAIAYGLKRKGVGRVAVIEQAEPGQAGIWRTIARMHQLRTPKTMMGPEQDNPALDRKSVV